MPFYETVNNFSWFSSQVG